MKTYCFLIFLLHFTVCLSAQMTVQYSTTEVLDKYDKKFRHWGGNNETIRFLVVRKITGVDTTVYAECQVENSAWETTARSGGVSVGGNGGWAVGISDFEKVENLKGIIRFSAQDYAMLINYLNQFLSITKSGNPEFDKTWTATFNARFSISLVFIQSNISKWSYVLSIDGANFEISTDESLEMIKKMAGFRRWLKIE